NLTGWQTYHTGSLWQKRGEEIYSFGKEPQHVEKRRVQNSLPERALHYHRPMVEDGTVNYEFYHDPGRALVHPLLDRAAFLLEPGGVRLHWLTDGNSDPSGLKHDNVFDEPANRRGPAHLPLKAKAWNQAKLTIQGDTLSLTLNGVEVYQRM